MTAKNENKDFHTEMEKKTKEVLVNMVTKEIPQRTWGKFKQKVVKNIKISRNINGSAPQIYVIDSTQAKDLRLQHPANDLYSPHIVDKINRFREKC